MRTLLTTAGSCLIRRNRSDLGMYMYLVLVFASGYVMEMIVAT
jgi:hypothetical protein